jgi:hypothetical protein
MCGNLQMAPKGGLILKLSASFCLHEPWHISSTILLSCGHEWLDDAHHTHQVWRIVNSYFYFEGIHGVRRRKLGDVYNCF